MTTRCAPARLARAIALALAGSALLSAAAGAADIWECGDDGNKYFTNVNPNRPHYLCVSRENPRVRIISPEGGPGCEYRATQPAGSCRTIALPAPAVAPVPAPAQQDAVADFRDRIRIGDRTSAGLVIELRPPIAKVQTADRERWYRIDELAPVR